MMRAGLTVLGWFMLGFVVGLFAAESYYSWISGPFGTVRSHSMTDPIVFRFRFALGSGLLSTSAFAATRWIARSTHFRHVILHLAVGLLVAALGANSHRAFYRFASEQAKSLQLTSSISFNFLPSLSIALTGIFGILCTTALHRIATQRSRSSITS
jgi:hypothetical protein